eukprot:TRINITY_DN652_c1_g3_i1.p2 TRINITY_DN652_c1_g3~~TRINITY_DN652_c1_g3_i1.p2  ORF type:complete len:1102 (+),score=458.93 TRINITY_DN652_c1_g3_i1:51019-54324(+)
MGIVAEHVQAGAGRGQQHDVARLRDGGSLLHGLLQAGAIDQLDTAVGQRRADGRGVASDQQHGARVLLHRQVQRRKVLALAIATGDEHDAIGTTAQAQAVQGRHGGADVGALAVVVVVHFLDHAHQLDPVRLARVVAQAMQQRRHRQVDGAAQRQCGQRVHGVVGATDLQGIGRHQALDRHRRRQHLLLLAAALAFRHFVVFMDEGIGQPQHAIVVDQAEAVGGLGLVQAEGRDGCGSRRHVHDQCIVAVEHAHGTLAEDAGLVGSIGLHAAVPVQVVLGQVQHGGGIGLQAVRGMQLEAGQFQHPGLRHGAAIDRFRRRRRRHVGQRVLFGGAGDFHEVAQVHRLASGGGSFRLGLRHHVGGHFQRRLDGRIDALCGRRIGIRSGMIVGAGFFGGLQQFQLGNGLLGLLNLPGLFGHGSASGCDDRNGDGSGFLDTGGGTAMLLQLGGLLGIQHGLLCCLRLGLGLRLGGGDRILLGQFDQEDLVPDHRFTQHIQRGRADIAGHLHRQAGALAQQASQAGHRGLAVGAGDGQDLRLVQGLFTQGRQGLGEQFDLAPQRQAALGDGRHQRCQFTLGRQARADRDKVHTLQQGRRQRLAQHGLGRRGVGAQGGQALGQRRFATGIGHTHAGAAVDQPPRHCQAGLTESEHQNVFARIIHRCFQTHFSRTPKNSNTYKPKGRHLAKIARGAVYPVRAAPSAQLQRRQAQQHQHHGDDPESHHHLGFLPALLLVVMVQRRHQQDATAGAETLFRILEIGHLDHHRQRLHHEDAAHDEQHDLLAHDHRDGAQRAAQRQRADVAHEDLRRIGVVPEEGQARAAHGATEDQQLASTGDVRDEQVLGIAGATGQVGEQAQRRAHQHGRHDGQAIQAIGQVDSIAGADDDEIGQGDETPHAQRIADGLEEGHDQVGLGRQVQAEAGTHPRHEQVEHLHVAHFRDREGQVERGHQADQRLPEILLARAHALRVAIDHLAVVIDPADGAEAERDDQHDPDETVGQVGPQQRGNANADQDQHAAHGRGAGLDQVGLGTVGAHRLADLHAGEHADHGGAGDHADQQGREGGEHRAEGDEVEQAQKAQVLLKILSEPDQHANGSPVDVACWIQR